MKYTFLNIRTNSHLKRNKTIRTNLPYKQALTVGIIFTVEDKQKHDVVKELVKKLEHDGKKVQVMEFLPKKKDNYEFMFDFFTEDDLTFWGNITSAQALKFADTPFDFLIYLDTVSNPLILHLLARSKSPCRIGKAWPASQPFFELMIESTSSTRSLMENIYTYTTQLK